MTTIRTGIRVVFAILIIAMLGALILDLQGCAYQHPPMVAIIARQSQYEEVKQLANWKSIYYRPSAVRYGCNLGDDVPGIDRQFTVYFDDALPWPIRTITPHLRGCAWRERIKETDETIGGKAYLGLTGNETIDAYALDHEVTHMTGRGQWNFRELMDYILLGAI